MCVCRSSNSGDEGEDQEEVKGKRLPKVREVWGRGAEVYDMWQLPVHTYMHTRSTLFA